MQLRRVFNVVNGGTPTTDEKNWDGGIPWATPVDLGEARGSLRTTRRTLTQIGVKSGSAMIPAGSVIVSTRAPIGYVAVTEFPAAFNQGCRGLVRISQGDSRYFAYQLASMKDSLQSLGLGSTFLEISSADLAGTELIVPSLAEQQRIVKFLDDETAKIDKVISCRARQAACLDELAVAAVSEQLIPGVLSNPVGRWPWSWLPEFEDEIPLVRLGYVSQLQTGLTVDAARDLTGDVVTRPYLRVANVQAGFVSLGSVTEITVPRSVAERSTLRSGDVLMTEGGDLDKLGRGTVWNGELADCLHQNHIFAVRPDRSRMDGEYLALMTRTIHGRSYFESTGTKTTNLASTNSSKILSFPVPLPSVHVQKNLVKQLKSELSSIESAKYALRRQQDVLAERRQALITAAVTGQLDVTTARGADV